MLVEVRTMGHGDPRHLQSGGGVGAQTAPLITPAFGSTEQSSNPPSHRMAAGSRDERRMS
ncbi:MAG: hypothetical protein Udaeo2_12630 [Candidatus Udaeobacter sp.]|nr:MAG: hypothetical protein Udaeo2_12630 [Candidatus Udaeobacter sp.]